MNKNSTSHELNDVKSFEMLENTYRQYSIEMPDGEIDKQIIAFAHRESGSLRSRKDARIPWWKRVQVPLYVSATFAFTIILANLFWPTPVKVPPGTSPGRAAIELMGEKQGSKESPGSYSTGATVSSTSIWSENTEKEEWAKNIAELFKSDDLKSARKELARFKKIYPNYPIEEQIEALQR